MSRKFRVVAFGVVLAGSATMIACIGELTNTVHFNTSEVDFGTPPPPLVIAPWDENTNRPVVHSSDLLTETPDKGVEDLQKSLYEKASYLEKIGKLEEASKVYLQYALMNPPDAERARDRSEVLSEQASGREKPPVRDYFDAIELPAEQAEPLLQRIVANPNAGFLRAHALYALAGLKYDKVSPVAAAPLYEQVAAIAGSPRREGALIMSARCLLYGPNISKDGLLWKDDPKTVVANASKATEHLNTLLKLYPKTRFRSSALGWLNRAKYVTGRRVDALKGYLREFAGETDAKKQVSLLSSIRRVSESLAPAEANGLRGAILADSTLLEPYLNFRLYHSQIKANELKGLAAFAKMALGRNNRAVVTSSVLARLAEICYLSKDPKSALAFAERSLQVGGKAGSRHDLAAYVMAGSYLKLNQYAKAVGTLQAHQSALSGSYLSKPAQELLAVAYEKQGELAKAVGVYEKLEYSLDVAYLVDVKMSLAQLRAFTESRASTSKANVWRYSLGLRYLRQDMLVEAEREFSAIPLVARDKLALPGSHDFAWVGADEKAGIDTLVDPLGVTRDLIQLRKEISRASQVELKASKTYELASYYYNHRNLMLYNAPLWGGMRQVMAGMNGSFNTPEDNRAVETHHYEHECLWRARKICLQLAKEYPNSSFAPKALYRAACASRRLANFNSWWRARNSVQDLYTDAADTLQRIYKGYPNDILAQNARKYEQVFRDEGKQKQLTSMFKSFKIEPQVN